jgi:hypothetical protein
MLFFKMMLHLSIQQLRKKASKRDRQAFDEATGYSYHIIQSLDTIWEGFGLGVSDSFQLKDLYKYSNARATIFYFAIELARELEEEKTVEYFRRRRTRVEYGDDDFYEAASGERVPRLTAITIKDGKTTLHLDDVLPALEDD